MGKLRAFIGAMCLLAVSTLGADWYISPTGTGNGTLGNPGGLLTAIAHTGWASAISGGDTIWLRGGTYTNPTFQELDWWAYPVQFAGSLGNPVTWRSYSNEWAAVDGSWQFDSGSYYHRFRDMEFFDSHKSTHIRTGYEAQGGPYLHFNMVGAGGDGAFEYINCVIHDIRLAWGGGGAWRVRGCIFWNIGQNGYEHITYSSTRYLEGNIAGWVSGRLVNFAGSSGFMVSSNITWVNRGGYIVTDATPGVTVGNRVYSPQYVDWIAGLDAHGASSGTITNNTFAVGQNPVILSGANNITFRNNTVVQMDASAGYPAFKANSIGSGWTVDLNSYFAVPPQSVVFESGSALSFAQWRAANPSFDVNSTASNASKPANSIHVYPNYDQPKRAHIAVYNWSGSHNVTVDLSGVLQVGDPYRLWSGQHFNGGPIATGILASTTLSIPMTNLAVAPVPYGTNSANSAMSPEFGAFLLIGPTDPSNPYPQGGSAESTNQAPANATPVANADSYTVAEDGTLTVAASGVLGNDTDADGNPLTASQVSGPSHGALSLASNGSFTYTPTANYVGSDSFTYRAHDGTAYSANATVSISITAVNDTPSAVANSYSVNEDSTLTVTAPGVLGNDSDVEGSALTALLVSTVTNGTLSLSANGSFTYTPSTNYFGPDAFTYRTSDGTATSTVAIVSITVNDVAEAPINTAPVAAADSYSVAQDSTLTVAAPGVLSNDTDAESNPLTAALDSGVSHGALSLNSNGSFVYTPTAGYSGSDSFSYQCSDGAADSSVVEVTITITAAPVGTNAPVRKTFGGGSFGSGRL